MRITPSMTAETALYNLQAGRQTLDALQEQVSSGLIVNRPSDDPLTARQIMDLQNQISAGDQYTSNIGKSSMLLNATGTALEGMASMMQQVKKIAGDMVSGTTDPTAISGAVSNLTQLREQLIDLGNTHIGDQYIFGGFASSRPFDSAGNFSGTDDPHNVEIAPGSGITTNVSGGTLLRGGTPAGSTGIDVLGKLSDLITAVANNDTSGIAQGIRDMKAAAEQINASASDVAGRVVRLDNMKSMIENNQNTLKTIYGNMQNVDLAKAGVQLSQQTTAFNAALATTAKLTQLSLLDYMK